MNQSEDKIKLEELEREIVELKNSIENLHSTIMVYEAKLIRLEGRKKSMLNYLNTDND